MKLISNEIPVTEVLKTLTTCGELVVVEALVVSASPSGEGLYHGSSTSTLIFAFETDKFDVVTRNGSTKRIRNAFRDPHPSRGSDPDGSVQETMSGLSGFRVGKLQRKKRAIPHRHCWRSSVIHHCLRGIGANVFCYQRPELAETETRCYKLREQIFETY